MPRFFFDVENGGRQRDEIGVECRDLDEVRLAAMRTLPAIVGEEVDGDDRYCVTIVARDEDGLAVFVTTLNLTGLWLVERDEA